LGSIKFVVFETRIGHKHQSEPRVVQDGHVFIAGSRWNKHFCRGPYKHHSCKVWL